MEQILDEDIIKGLKKLKFSLWNKLLQKTPLSDCDRKAFLKNPQYIAAGQRATQRESSQNVWNFQEDEIFHLYQAVNGLLTALPAIQAMQIAEKENGIEEETERGRAATWTGYDSAEIHKVKDLIYDFVGFRIRTQEKDECAVKAIFGL